MQNEQEKEDYGITIFSSNIPSGEKCEKSFFSSDSVLSF